MTEFFMRSQYLLQIFSYTHCVSTFYYENPFRQNEKHLENSQNFISFCIFKIQEWFKVYSQWTFSENPLKEQESFAVCIRMCLPSARPENIAAPGPSPFLDPFFALALNTANALSSLDPRRHNPQISSVLALNHTWLSRTLCQVPIKHTLCLRQ